MSQATLELQWDPVVSRTLRDDDGLIDEIEFESLIERHVVPLATRVLKSRFGGFPSRGPNVRLTVEEDMADLEGECIRLVIQRIRTAAAGGADVIQNLDRYVAKTAHRVFDEYLRRKNPRRSSISNKLRYLLRNRTGLALWTDSEGGLVSGFEQWKVEQVSVRGRIRQRAERDANAVLQAVFAAGEDPKDFQALVVWLLRENGGPASFSDLVASVALVTGTVDQEPVSHEDLGAGHAEAIAPSDISSPDVLTEMKQELELLWSELCELPLKQRCAILLNLRDHRGKGIVALLPILEVASLDQIAEALETDLGDLRSFWDDLPLDDSAIADRIGATPAQVIGLRRAGRARLQRRMEAKN